MVSCSAKQVEDRSLNLGSIVVSFLLISIANKIRPGSSGIDRSKIVFL